MSIDSHWITALIPFSNFPPYSSFLVFILIFFQNISLNNYLWISMWDAIFLSYSISEMTSVGSYIWLISLFIKFCIKNNFLWNSWLIQCHLTSVITVRNSFVVDFSSLCTFLLYLLFLLCYKIIQHYIYIFVYVF